MGLLAARTASVKNASKVPEVVLGFWLVKILATTLGETAGASVSMTVTAGYAVANLLFVALFTVAIGLQLTVRRYVPSVYWFAVVVTIALGMTLSGYLARRLGGGYVSFSLLLFVLLVSMLLLWRWVGDRVACQGIAARRDEVFYWLVIAIASTLGTALGDLVVDDLGLGFVDEALLFGALLAPIAVAYFATRISPVNLFWGAFVLTQPLGSTLGDVLMKPRSEGGLAVGTVESYIFLLSSMMLTLLISSEFARLRRSDDQ